MTLSQGLAAAVRDLEHRVQGIASRARGVATARSTNDDVVLERVRSRLGHVSSFPHAIRVTCEEGVVRLTGPILRGEAERVLSVARATIGVHRVEDALERHAEGDDVAGLRGIPRSARQKTGYWTPAERLFIGASGAAAAIVGAARGGFGGLAMIAGGTAALARSVANIPFAEIAGVGGRRPAIDVEKTILVHAPVDRVFELFARPEEMAPLLRHVESIERVGESRWRWRVRGPAGIAFEWDALFDQVAPYELVVWKSADDASVRQLGSARFEWIDPLTTRVTIRLRYWPPAGLVGHEIAHLLGDDPESELDEDLRRIKTMLESETRVHH